MVLAWLKGSDLAPEEAGAGEEQCLTEPPGLPVPGQEPGLEGYCGQEVPVMGLGMESQLLRLSAHWEGWSQEIQPQCSESEANLDFIRTSQNPKPNKNQISNTGK